MMTVLATIANFQRKHWQVSLKNVVNTICGDFRQFTAETLENFLKDYLFYLPK
jgi:hypothetical protein